MQRASLPASASNTERYTADEIVFKKGCEISSVHGKRRSTAWDVRIFLAQGIKLGPNVHNRRHLLQRVAAKIVMHPDNEQKVHDKLHRLRKPSKAPWGQSPLDMNSNRFADTRARSC